MHNLIEGSLTVGKSKVAIVTARFNDIITSKLTDGAIDCLTRHGMAVKDITEYKVPGAFEIPLIADKVAESGKYDAVLCVGAVIKGETAHFDQVVNAVTSGVANVSLNRGLPVIYCVLTTDTVEQAMDRAGAKQGNKGWDCAEVLLEMLDLLKKI